MEFAEVESWSSENINSGSNSNENHNSTVTSSPPSTSSSGYENQKRRDWDTFCQYLQNHKPPLTLSGCSGAHAWGSLDALVGRLRAAFDESGGKTEANPFGARAVRLYLREVRDSQSKARGISYEKKRRKRLPLPLPPSAPPPSGAS
ncbi:hypothetical protein Nepgr_004174 [Nepenthes gracilis]|uniref:ALOG domain-containing protein n=1 Tax=Nepenthes gracilis TaxID=150966 RepID=A0AAD3S0U9_NEPGR|nr:hypothetical protein Nepgr_004174 [Nepenthes gracilis]